VSADLAFREAELEVMTAGDRLFHEAETHKQLYSAIEEIIDGKFASDVPYVVAWSIENAAHTQIFASKKASGEPRYLEFAQSNFRSNDIFDTASPAIFSGSDLQSAPEELNLGEKTLVYLPLMAHDRRIGLLCAFFRGNSHQTRLRVLRQVIDKFCNAHYRISRIDEEYRSARIDPLTDLPNRRAVYDMLPAMVAHATEDSPVSALIVEVDNLEDMKEKYGHVVVDQVMQELTHVMQSSARVEELAGSRPNDKYIRYDTSQFLLLSEDADGTQALAVAERIREAVDKKVDWPAGVPCLSVSIGIASYPTDAKDAKDLMTRAEVSLMYLKEHDERNSAIRFDQVPRHFRSAKLSGAVSGSLEVFDPATTLQSVARAQRTGILTVTNEAGRVFWSFFEHGKLEKAYLDAFRADVAVVEFLATFSDGAFDFREYDLLDVEALEYIHQLDESYDCKKSLDRNLMDGALAQDQLAEARRLLPNTRLFVKPSGDFKLIVAALPTLKDPPSRVEIETMAAICKYVNGRTMLCTIIDKLQHSVPTHLRWHAAALLVRYEAVELTKLALSFTL
jgi:diguanylate cyclase (GGDEF)-like protein